MTVTGSGAAACTLQDLVERFGGTCGGDLQRRVHGFAPLDDRQHRSAGLRDRCALYRGAVAASAASAVLVTAKDAELLPEQAARLWICRDPYLQFALIAQHFESLVASDVAPGIDPTAVIGPDARIDPSAIVGPLVVVGAGVSIGARTRIGAGSLIGDGTRIGEDGLLHPGTTVLSAVARSARAASCTRAR